MFVNKFTSTLAWLFGVEMFHLDGWNTFWLPRWNLPIHYKCNIWLPLHPTILCWRLFQSSFPMYPKLTLCDRGVGLHRTILNHMLVARRTHWHSMHHIPWTIESMVLFTYGCMYHCSEKIPPWAIGSGCPERYKSDNSLILNLGLHDVTRSMLSPILSDYDRINSVYQTHRSDQQMVEYHRMLIVRGCLH